MEKLELFTVISFDPDNGQILSDLIRAFDGYDALYRAAQKRPEDTNFICAIAGVHEEEKGAFYAGTCFVDGYTIKEQADVFKHDKTN